MTRLITNELYKIIKKKSTLIILSIWFLILVIQMYKSNESFFAISTDFSVINVVITIFSATILTEEFSKKTIKFLLLKPHTRGEILLSKFIAILVLAAVLDILQVGIAFIIELFQTQNILADSNLFINLLFGLMTNLIAQLLYITFTILVSLFTKSQSLAIAGSIIVVFFGNILNVLLISEFNFWLIKINPLNMFNITLLNMNENSGMHLLSFWQYLIGILIYSAIFYYLTYTTFKNKDIVFS